MATKKFEVGQRVQFRQEYYHTPQDGTVVKYTATRTLVSFVDEHGDTVVVPVDTELVQSELDAADDLFA